MKFLDEYRDADHARRYADTLGRLVTRPWTIMEVCGGQTHSIVRFGVDELLPPEVTLVHGPGCPVCVTPVALIDAAIEIARRPGVIFTSFGDMLRVPGTETDLLSAKAHGADVRMVYSPLDAVEIARVNPSREVVFFAVGFETTAPANAMAVYHAARGDLHNFSLLVSHVLVPPAIEAILGSPANRVQGFLAAGHVCTIMGFEEYEPIVRRYRVPIVVTGFEPLDILQGVTMCVRQLEEGRCDLENQVLAFGLPRRQPRGAAPDPRGVRDRPQGLAWHRRDCRQRPVSAWAIRRPRCVAALSNRARGGQGVRRVHCRPGPARAEEAGRLPGVCDALLAGAAARRSDGLFRGRLCGVLSLSPLRAR